MGRETLREFNDEGATVVVAEISDKTGAELGNRVHYFHCDVSKAEDVRNLVDMCVSRLGRLDIRFNYAGITGNTDHVDSLDEDFADLQRTVSVDLLGVMLGCRWASRAMARNGGGSIINTASTAGFLGDWACAPTGR